MEIKNHLYVGDTWHTINSTYLQNTRQYETNRNWLSYYGHVYVLYNNMIFFTCKPQTTTTTTLSSLRHRYDIEYLNPNTNNNDMRIKFCQEKKCDYLLIFFIKLLLTMFVMNFSLHTLSNNNIQSDYDWQIKNQLVVIYFWWW